MAVVIWNDVDEGFRDHLQTGGANNLALLGIFGCLHRVVSCFGSFPVSRRLHINMRWSSYPAEWRALCEIALKSCKRQREVARRRVGPSAPNQHVNRLSGSSNGREANHAL